MKRITETFKKIKLTLRSNLLTQFNDRVDIVFVVFAVVMFQLK